MISKNSHHFLRVIVALCYLTVGLSIIPVPLIVSQSFHADIKLLGLVMGIYAFIAIPARILTGIVMLKIGYRATLFGAALLLSVSALICSWAESVTIMLIGRSILGIGTGAMMAVATAWMVELPVMRSKTGQAIGSIGTINYAILALSAPAGEYLSHVWGAHYTLLITSLFPLLALAIIPKLATITNGPSDSTPKRALEVVLLASIVPGIALLISGIGYASIVSFGLEIGTYHHLGTGASLVLVFGITMVFARVFLSNMTDLLSTGLGITIVFAIEALGLLLLAHSETNLGLWAGAMAIGVAMSFIYPALGVRVSLIAGKYRGSALSVYGAFINAGIGVGSILTGFMISHWSLLIALTISSAIVLIGGGVSMCLPFLERISKHHS
ncbi:MFS transporter [Enterobacter bugandensis]|uniref:MFS transporter n=1 Tax=Enterobacter bugandensis TaxID=881260 RepID=UPI00131ED626|nr:MFS transporter [Enterobacter bugandensis]QWZ48833.1 MFS transporter [Enterobacter bugandensis]UBH41094.1 MFS transporter [Enterobacter bugandensis]UBH92806.1 MFS transporter [Enterobacter bugandensis]UBH99406.1 MFS transporter [Enterobacter bugandensis]